MDNDAISLNNLSLYYDNKPLFIDLSLIIPSKRWVALLGPSGVGKTSLLHILAGLTQADRGTVTIKQDDIAYMAQTDLLLPWATALENAMLSHTLRAQTCAASIIKQRALTLFESMGLKEAIHLYPHQLSGGMRQRVALIRTLLADKSIILMDEPFSAIDAITRYKLQNLAAVWLEDKTVIFITHDPLEALRLADDIYIMQGSPATLQLATQLESKKPRTLNDPALLTQQARLFELLQVGAS